MNEVKRYGNTWCEVTERTVFKHDQQDGDYVKLSDYASLQEQLTNAQEALKSAGIEADTVQAGVMELKAQRDAIAAENAALKEYGDTLNDMHNNLNGEGTGIQGRAEVACQQVALEAALEEFDAIQTPATDAWLNAVRADAIVEAASRIAAQACEEDEAPGIVAAVDALEIIEREFRAAGYEVKQ